MLKRIQTKARIGESQTRYRTVIEDDDSPQDSEMARIRRYYFLKELADNQDLLNCGYYKYDTLKIFHNGNRWIAECEALVTNDPQISDPASTRT